MTGQIKETWMDWIGLVSKDWTWCKRIKTYKIRRCVKTLSSENRIFLMLIIENQLFNTVITAFSRTGLSVG